MLEIGFVLYPHVTQLDLTGPYEVLSRLKDTRTHLIWKSRDPVRTEHGMEIRPTLSMAEAPQMDVIVVPGGPGITPILEDDEIHQWLWTQAEGARYITSVCTGSLILGAAGLLRGYRATSHWMSVDFLSDLGAIPVRQRVVVDRNRITAGGVTGGIDFGLLLASLLRGEDEARRIQLILEYNPAPPFNAGSPEGAGERITAAYYQAASGLLEERRSVIERIKARRASRSA